MATTNTITPEQYETLKADVGAGRMVYHAGRSAVTVEQLDAVIEHAKNQAEWSEEMGASRLVRGSMFPGMPPIRGIGEMVRAEVAKAFAERDAADQTPKP